VRDTVRTRLGIMIKTILKKYKYPPDKQEAATETVLRQAETLSAAWVE
jgi:type I restriction enzyme R subunit